MKARFPLITFPYTAFSGCSIRYTNIALTATATTTPTTVLLLFLLLLTGIAGLIFYIFWLRMFLFSWGAKVLYHNSSPEFSPLLGRLILKI